MISGVSMEVPENEAFVLHEKRIKSFADMARHLNPLSYEDFMSHRNNVIRWVEHSGKDHYLAGRLKKEKNKDKFVELLALRHKKEEAKNFRVSDCKAFDKDSADRELRVVKKKIEELGGEYQDKKIPRPKPFSETAKKITKGMAEGMAEGITKGITIEFDFEDFMKLLDEAKHHINMKQYHQAIRYYEKLKDRFEKSRLNIEEKKILHKKIKGLYHEIADSIKN